MTLWLEAHAAFREGRSFNFLLNSVFERLMVGGTLKTLFNNSLASNAFLWHYQVISFYGPQLFPSLGGHYYAPVGPRFVACDRYSYCSCHRAGADRGRRVVCRA